MTSIVALAIILIIAIIAYSTVYLSEATRDIDQVADDALRREHDYWRHDDDR